MENNEKAPAKPAITEHWHLIRCHTGMTSQAAAGLLERKIEAYVPKSHRRERIGREAKIITTLRLPGHYAFVQLQDDAKNQKLVLDQAGVVAAERGVSHIFANDRGVPIRIPREEIRVLKQMEAEEYSDAGKPPSKAKPIRFDPGQTVTIVRHEFWEGYEGEVITCCRGIARLVVRNMIVTVPDCDIRVATFQAERNAA